MNFFENLRDPNNPFSLWYRVKVETPAKARIYNRFLLAKVIGQSIMLLALLALSGWTAPMLSAAGFGLAFWIWKVHINHERRFRSISIPKTRR